MEGCIFCEILAGRAPASFVYQDENLAVFLDIQPVNPGHMLVIPRQHALNLAGLDPNTAAQMMQAGQRAAQALYQSGLRCEGVNLFLADGEAAGQEVFHVHLHVFPRWEGDGFGLRFGAKYLNMPTRAELDEVARRLTTILH